MALRVESLAMRRLAVAATVVALVRPCAAAPPRFFVEGPGTLAIENAHTGERAAVVYRRADGTYDPDALARLAHVFRSADGRETPIALRLVEVLGRLQALSGTRPLVLMSGYRSPDYNAALRAPGRPVAGGSLPAKGSSTSTSAGRGSGRPRPRASTRTSPPAMRGSSRAPSSTATGRASRSLWRCTRSPSRRCASRAPRRSSPSAAHRCR